jgi:hypothetical protein
VQTAILTTETLENQDKTPTVLGALASTISVAPKSVVGDPAPNLAPTPTPAPASANDPTTVTIFATLNQTSTYSTSRPSVSPSPSSSPTFQNIFFDTSQDVGPVSSASSSSSQTAVHATSQDTRKTAGQPKTEVVVIIGGTAIGLSFSSILLFAVYLMWRRKQKATRHLSQLDYESAYGSAREPRMRIVPFLQPGALINTATNLGTEPSLQHHGPHRMTRDH